MKKVENLLRSLKNNKWVLGICEIKSNSLLGLVGFVLARWICVNEHEVIFSSQIMKNSINYTWIGAQIVYIYKDGRTCQFFKKN